MILPTSQKSMSNSPLRRNIKLNPSQVKLDSLATNLPAFSVGQKQKAALITMCYNEPRMVENLPNFYRRIVNIKDCNNKPIFEPWELDQIVIAA